VSDSAYFVDEASDGARLSSRFLYDVDEYRQYVA